MSIRDWPLSERPREKLLEQGPQATVGSRATGDPDPNRKSRQSALDVARNLLVRFGSLRSLLTAEREQVCAAPGLGASRYVALQAALELARRHYQQLMTCRLRARPIRAHAGIFAHAAARSAARGVLLRLSGQPQPRHRLRGAVPRHDRRRERAPAGSRQRGPGPQCRRRDPCPQSPSGIAEPSQADELITRRLKEASGPGRHPRAWTTWSSAMGSANRSPSGGCSEASRPGTCHPAQNRLRCRTPPSSRCRSAGIKRDSFLGRLTILQAGPFEESPCPESVRSPAKGPMTGNRVSHANNKRRRRFLPNLHVQRFWLESERRFVSLRVSDARSAHDREEGHRQSRCRAARRRRRSLKVAGSRANSHARKGQTAFRRLAPATTTRRPRTSGCTRTRWRSRNLTPRFVSTCRTKKRRSSDEKEPAHRRVFFWLIPANGGQHQMPPRFRIEHSRKKKPA